MHKKFKIEINLANYLFNEAMDGIKGIGVRIRIMVF